MFSGTGQAKGNTKRRIVALLAVVFIVGTLVMIERYTYACYGNLYDSIHFHSGDPDFGIPPRRAILTWRGEHDDRPQSEDGDGGGRSGLELDYTKDEERATEIERKLGVMLRAVDADVAQRQWQRARLRIERFSARYGWRGSLRDRVEVMQQLEARHSPPTPSLLADLRLYLARLRLDEVQQDRPADSALLRIIADPAADFLREHALYQQAALEAKFRNDHRAVELFLQLLQRFPQTAKREDILVMIARSALLPSNELERHMPEGRTALAQLEREYPHTRFRRDIVGLHGRLAFLAGQWQQAADTYFANQDLPSIELILKAMPAQQRGPVRVRLFAAYLHALITTQTWNKYAHVLAGADATRHAMTAPQFAAFGQLVLQQPETAAGYLYYRLYHTETTAKDQRSLAQLADRLVARYPLAQMPATLKVRLAEVYYRDRDYRRALAWANRALTTGASDRALYVRAATRNKLGVPDGAFADFLNLTRRFPQSPLVHGAQENLALLYEAKHDDTHALDLYFALDYKPDIAYYLDVRLTTAQVAAYLRHALQLGTDREEQDLIAYALGIRYLRDERWNEARRLLSAIPKKRYNSFRNNFYDGDTNPYDVTDPLRACADLEKLQRAVARAHSANARASALYRYAAYYTSHDELLLYNTSLWKGERAIDFELYWNVKRSTSADKAAIRTHIYAHEVYARSHTLCMKIIHDYPHSPTRPYALMLAAIDALHLAHFNVLWNEENKRHNYLAEVYSLKARLVREYPHHHLAAKIREHARISPNENKLYWKRPEIGVAHRTVMVGDGMHR